MSSELVIDYLLEDGDELVADEELLVGEQALPNGGGRNGHRASQS
jgi:hypothetical protein